MEINVDQINWLIQNRRSVFVNQFEPDKKIPDEIVMQLLENANWAPTHKKTEPWRFTVFTGEGLKKLAAFQAELYKKTRGQKFKQAVYEKLLVTPPQCSHIISIGMKRSTTIDIPEMEEIAAVACAVQNLYLSTTAYGLGGYWTTGGITFDEEAKPFLGLEREDKLLGFFYLGYIKIPSGKGTRSPIETKTVWVNE
ncbi:MAG: nitroreductase [Bacteroidetes bacterium]|nr:nitroreductase [Bacteroidota bacterium]